MILRLLTLTSFVLLFARESQAQVQTYQQCVTSAKARAGLTLSPKDLKALCENNSDEVVTCALTLTQSARFTGSLQQSIKDCRKQFIYPYL